MISAGTLAYTIDLLKPTTTVSTLGEQQTTWSVFCRTRANIIQQKGNRSTIGGETWDNCSAVFIMRYRLGVDFRYRIHRSDTHEIFAITNIATDKINGSITIQAVAMDKTENYDPPQPR